MRHPFLRLSKNYFPKFFWPFFLSTIIFLFLMNMVSEPLVTSQAPQGMTPFELARTPERSTAILNSWDSTQKVIAAFSLGLDYFFILLYSTTLSLGCVWTSSIMFAKRPPLAMIGIIFAWLQWVAAILDGIENVALFRLLLNNISSLYPQLAFWCAVFKFGIIFAGIICCLFAMVLNISDQRRRSSESNGSLIR